MEAVLLVGSEKLAESIGALLLPRYCAHLTCAVSGARARRLLSGQAWDMVIISAPLPDENARRLAGEIAAAGQNIVLLLEDTSAENIENSVITLTKPVNRVLFEHTLRILSVTHRHLAALREENRKAAAKLEEARLIGRAKCALVAFRQMTESEAHHYIEKQAMDSRLPRKEVAKDILHTFEG